jgi:hypothetical protein
LGDAVETAFGDVDLFSKRVKAFDHDVMVTLPRIFDGPILTRASKRGQPAPPCFRPSSDSSWRRETVFPHRFENLTETQRIKIPQRPADLLLVGKTNQVD